MPRFVITLHVTVLFCLVLFPTPLAKQKQAGALPPKGWRPATHGRGREGRSHWTAEWHLPPWVTRPCGWADVSPLYFLQKRVLRRGGLWWRDSDDAITTGQCSESDLFSFCWGMRCGGGLGIHIFLAPPKGLQCWAQGHSCGVTCFVEGGDGQHLLGSTRRAWEVKCRLKDKSTLCTLEG